MSLNDEPTVSFFKLQSWVSEYYAHTFQLDILTSTECGDAFTDAESTTYQDYSTDVVVIVRNVLTARVDANLRLLTPTVNFVGFRFENTFCMHVQVCAVKSGIILSWYATML